MGLFDGQQDEGVRSALRILAHAIVEGVLTPHVSEALCMTQIRMPSNRAWRRMSVCRGANESPTSRRPTS